jgi:hypothetical protein
MRQPLRQNQQVVIALFACLVLWCGWQSRISSTTPPHRQTVESAAHAAENKTTQDIAAEIVAYYTKVLAWFTGVLALASIGQGFMLLRTDKITRRAADAAKESADHIPRVERAYLHGGGEPIGVQMWPEKDGVQNLPTFRLDINNHGKTPGELLEYGIGWCRISEIDDLPLTPHYKWYYYRDFVQSNAPREIKKLKMPNDIPISDAVIFGRFGYKDIFGECHSNGFVQHGGNPIMAPHLTYTEADPPWDIPFVGNRKFRKYEKND